MNDIVEELRDYINNTDDCHLRVKAAEEIEALRAEIEQMSIEVERYMFSSMQEYNAVVEQLAASQAREQQLREALTGCVCAMQDYQAGIGITEMFDKSERLGRLALQSEKQNTSALQAMITKAGEVMRGRCCKVLFSYPKATEIAIRTLPCVTLEDLK